MKKYIHKAKNEFSIKNDEIIRIIDHILKLTSGSILFNIKTREIALAIKVINIHKR